MQSNAREADKLEVFFSTYKSPTEESIGPEGRQANWLAQLSGFTTPYQLRSCLTESHSPVGIMSLCQDLGLDPADRKVLVLAWKLNAQRQGFFTWEEFQRGLALREWVANKHVGDLLLIGHCTGKPCAPAACQEAVIVAHRYD